MATASRARWSTSPTDDRAERFTRQSERLQPSAERAGPRDESAGRRAVRGAAHVAVVAGMAVAFAVMWFIGPVGWLWLASRLATSSQPDAVLYGMVAVGIAGTAAGCLVVLTRLDAAYCKLSGATAAKRVRPQHLRPSCEDPRSGKRQATPLDAVAVGVVTVALLVLGLWFFAFAGPPTPPGL